MNGNRGTGEGRHDDGAGLDPAEDPAGWERRVEAITAAAEPELRRRAGEAPGLLGAQLERWAGPVLAAAAGLIIAGTAILALSGAPSDRGGTFLTGPAPAGSGETLVSPVVDPWLESDTLTIGAVEEIVTARAGPGGGLR